MIFTNEQLLDAIRGADSFHHITCALGGGVQYPVAIYVTAGVSRYRRVIQRTGFVSPALKGAYRQALIATV